MNDNYRTMMDQQTPSQDLHESLLNLPDRRVRRSRWPLYAITGALAACAALLVGLHLWAFPSAPQAPNQLAVPPHTAPTVEQTQPQASQTTQPRQLPELRYGTPAPEADASIALPKGYFEEALTPEDLAGIWGAGTWWEEAGWTLSGSALYGGTGELFWVSLSGEAGDQGRFTLTMCPDQLPPTCIVADSDGITDVWGTEVSATRSYYDSDADQRPEYHYALSFLRDSGETVGARLELEATSDASAQALIEKALTQLLSPDQALRLRQLVPAEIPQWRSEQLTWEEAKLESGFEAYLPAQVPARFQFEEGWRELGQNRDYLTLLWTQGYDSIFLCIDRLGASYPADYLQTFQVDVENPASYDLRLYEIPWCDIVPEEYLQTISNPVFLAEDVTWEVMQAREQQNTDSGTSRFQFEILYPDGVSVRYMANITAEELWAIVEPTLPK